MKLLVRIDRFWPNHERHLSPPQLYFFALGRLKLARLHLEKLALTRALVGPLQISTNESIHEAVSFRLGELLPVRKPCRYESLHRLLRAAHIQQ